MDAVEHPAAGCTNAVAYTIHPSQLQALHYSTLANKRGTKGYSECLGRISLEIRKLHNNTIQLALFANGFQVKFVHPKLREKAVDMECFSSVLPLCQTDQLIVQKSEAQAM